MLARRGEARWPCALAIFTIVALAITAMVTDAAPYTKNGALLFHDHAVVLQPVNNFDTDAFTFEAWLSASDYCHRSSILSYALNSNATEKAQWVADFNHFVIFDTENVVACHDFELIDLLPDPRRVSCAAQFNHTDTANFVERDGTWHHLAVTWTAANDGLTRIYKDGLLMAEARTGKTKPIQSGGALMLGGEQDCFGGCTDKGQGYYGYMDEVRLWRTERSQEDIIRWMRASSGLENHKDLIAYWKFDDTDEPVTVAHDSSGNHNHLPLRPLPTPGETLINGPDGQKVAATALSFRNNYAINDHVTDMPTADFTVAFWARTPAMDERYAPRADLAELFSYATYLEAPTGSGSRIQHAFVDDAILIEKYNKEYRGMSFLDYHDVSTAGSVSVHINANRQGAGGSTDRWMDFNVGWKDGDWHYLAVTWRQSGETHFYFDGHPQTPFWVSEAGRAHIKEPGKTPSTFLAGGTRRASTGSLVLGQNQECYGGCFSAEAQLNGDLAELRVWDHALGEDEIVTEMWHKGASKKQGLTLEYDFAHNSRKIAQGQWHVPNLGSSGSKNDLMLGADAPLLLHSTAPLTDARGLPLPPPPVGHAGHALALHDQQVLMLSNFQNFPARALTVEFWMLSVDSCRKGVPFSYAAGDYDKSDNALLIFGYNDWGVSVMEDEGTLADHTSGTGATDGKWHHIAVTWRSEDGRVNLYDNGRLAWEVTRSRGKTIPSGGTLVIGREQDCPGGCFDSARGATGKVQEIWDQEYGPQDFFGLIDEIRIWDHVRGADEIAKGMQADLGRIKEHSEATHVPDVSKDSRGLVAYWTFDEGEGYIVHDLTESGHDLQILAEPKWVPVETPFAVCGNGVVETGEQCDDGSKKDGDGCSATCQIEEGYSCTGTNPSVCVRIDAAHPAADRTHSGRIPESATPDSSTGRGGRQHGEGSAGQHAATVVLACLVAVTISALLGMVVFNNRGAIAAALPEVTRHFGGMLHVWGDGPGHGVHYQGLDPEGLDPEDLTTDMAPEFLGSQPGPRGAGSYTRLLGAN